MVESKSKVNASAKVTDAVIPASDNQTPGAHADITKPEVIFFLCLRNDRFREKCECPLSVFPVYQSAIFRGYFSFFDKIFDLRNIVCDNFGAQQK
jgi:hypothetical protein